MKEHFKHLLLDLDEEMAFITLNRPEKCNALNVALMEELKTAIEVCQEEKGCRCVLITARGQTFCSGLDLYEAVDSELIEKMALAMSKLLKAIYLSPIITIAVVHADAYAGGAGLVAACDLALMAEEAKIGFPETRRGLVAAQVAALLCRQMRMRDVRELLLLGEVIDGQRALAIGLVNRLVKKEELLESAIQMGKEVLKGAPMAVQATKQLLDSLTPRDFLDDLELALSIHRFARQSAEAREGIQAFLEKRPPTWMNG